MTTTAAAPVPTPEPREAPEAIAADAARALIAANRRRRLARRWIGLCSIPLVLAGVLFVGKVVSMYAFAHQSITAYVAGDDSGSVNAARGLDPLNWFEPYKAPYDQGVGLTESGELAAGEQKFTEALALAHGLEQCAVRFNLALTLEREGDAAASAQNPTGAVEFYAKALEINAGRPAECDSTQAQQQSPDPSRDPSQSNKDQKDRLQQKQQEQQQKQQNPDQPQPDPNQQPQQPDQSGLDELQKQLQQGEQDRQQYQQGGDDDGGGSGTDKPW